MQTKREKDLIKKISSQYGHVIDLKKTPGVLVEILREYGPSIGHVLDGEGGGGGAPSAPLQPHRRPSRSRARAAEASCWKT